MDHTAVQPFLDQLKSADAGLRQQATDELWKHWFQQKGPTGVQQLLRSQTLLSAGAVDQAEMLLNDVIEAEPDFAEAWNRRAVLYYTQHQFQQAATDCHQVLTLVPYHFGASHGLGLCHMRLQDYQSATQAFRQALAIQPHALINQQLLLECMLKLS